MGAEDEGRFALSKPPLIPKASLRGLDRVEMEDNYNRRCCFFFPSGGRPGPLSGGSDSSQARKRLCASLSHTETAGDRDQDRQSVGGYKTPTTDTKAATFKRVMTQTLNHRHWQPHGKRQPQISQKSLHLCGTSLHVQTCLGVSGYTNNTDKLNVLLKQICAQVSCNHRQRNNNDSSSALFVLSSS